MPICSAVKRQCGDALIDLTHQFFVFGSVDFAETALEVLFLYGLRQIGGGGHDVPLADSGAQFLLQRSPIGVMRCVFAKLTASAIGGNIIEREAAAAA